MKRKITLKRLVIVALFLCLTFSFKSLLVTEAVAETKYPVRPILTIVPWGTGGGIDTLCRQISELMSPMLGVSCPIKDVPGATGTIGMREALSKPADGYTMVAMTAGTFLQTMLGKLDYQLNRDYIPLVRLAVTESLFFVDPKAPWQTGSELLDYVKKHPKEVAVGVASITGGDGRVLGRLAARGIKFKPIVYKKAGERYVSVIGGHNPVLLEQYADVQNYVKAGQLVPVLSLTNERVEPYLDVPCMKDVGIDGWTGESANWQSLVMKAGSPAVSVKTLTEALDKIMHSETMIKYFQNKGLDVKVGYMNAENLGKFLEDQKRNFDSKYLQLSKELLE